MMVYVTFGLQDGSGNGAHVPESRDNDLGWITGGGLSLSLSFAPHLLLSLSLSLSFAPHLSLSRSLSLSLSLFYIIVILGHVPIGVGGIGVKDKGMCL